jgi:hypothetical protein
MAFARGEAIANWDRGIRRWQAQKLVRKNPKLAALPRYAFRPPAPSEYRIRREPHEDYVSTIEALVHVLAVLEGDRDRFRAILVPFRRMVEMQVAFAEKSRGPRRVLVRKRGRAPVDPRTRIPAILRERAADLVCVYAEANAWPYDASERERPADELVQWVACRAATGETFESILVPRRPLCPATPFHLGLEPGVLARGESAGAMLERWSRFLRPSDVLCAWGDSTSELFAEDGGTLEHPRVDLRRVAREFARERVGSLETFRARVRAEAPPPAATGRAGLRLASLVAVTRFFAASTVGPLSAWISRRGERESILARADARARMRGI